MVKFFQTILGSLVFASLAVAGENVLVIGDSVSKEYETEFKGLYPDNPDAWDARNWNEILDARRNSKFDLGSWGVFADFRLTGHTFNCAKPGGTAREFRNFLRQDDAAEDEIKASSGGSLIWPFFETWRDTFDDLIDDAEKIVIFYGANDIALGNSDPLANPPYGGGSNTKQIDYESIYEGTFGQASNPDLLRDSIRKNVRSIVQYFRDDPAGSAGPRFSGPIVLVNAAHVGCTPKVIGDTGTNQTRHAVCTAMIESLNDGLRALADEFNLGYADVYAMTNQIRLPGDYTIGGITFSEVPDDDCRPRYLFSGDGFHVNTPAQAKVAQIILDAFRTKYPTTAGNTSRLSDREIIEDILGLEPDTGFKEWLDDHDVPANRRGPLSDPDDDGVENVLEFALAGRAPDAVEGDPLLRPMVEGSGGLAVLRFDYTPRFAENVYCDLVPQKSSTLGTWTEVPASQMVKNADGSISVRVPLTAGVPLFVRLAARVVP